MSHPETFDKILSSAKGLLSKSGFTEMTMKQIADDVGVTKAALYHFFSSKEDIYVEVMKNLIEDAHNNLQKIKDEGLSASKTFQKAVKAQLDFGMRNRSIIQFWHLAEAGIDPNKRGKLCDAHKHIHQFFGELLQEMGVEKPALATHVLQSSVLMYIKHVDHAPLPPEGEFAEYLSGLFVSA